MFTVELCEQDTGRQEAEAYQCSLSALLLPYPRIAACFDSSYIIGSGVCARKIQKEPVVFLHGVEKVTLDGRTPSNSRLIPYNSHWLADRTLAPLEAHGSGGGAQCSPKWHVGDCAGCPVGGMCDKEQHRLASWERADAGLRLNHNWDTR